MRLPNTVEEDSMKKSAKGFSLIELLIVVAIILIIAAIAIPNLLRSRIAANQASAVGSLRTLNTAEITYSSTYNVGFTYTMSYLMPPATAGANPTSTAAGLIDSVLGAGSKSGYSFTYSPGATDTTGRINVYGIIAVPISSSTGTNYYYTDQSGVIRQNSTTTAASTDSPIGG
jgi:type IV pilus assembly protein PilA